MNLLNLLNLIITIVVHLQQLMNINSSSLFLLLLLLLPLPFSLLILLLLPPPPPLPSPSSSSSSSPLLLLLLLPPSLPSSSQLTYADLALLTPFSFLTTKVESASSDYLYLSKLCSNVENLPTISKWLKERPEDMV